MTRLTPLLGLNCVVARGGHHCLQAGADVSITNGGQRTASELVRLEISELKNYADELTAEVDQEVHVEP